MIYRSVLQIIVQKLCIVHEWKNVPVECYSTCSVICERELCFLLLINSYTGKSKGVVNFPKHSLQIWIFLCCPPGSKALDYSNGMFDCQSPTSPFMGSLRALHLLEELRSVLEVMDTEERESLRCQIPDSTVESLGEWIHGHLVRCEAACHSTSEFHASPLLRH